LLVSPQSPSHSSILTASTKVVNDDGPPSSQSSPYVHSFIKTLQEAGHVVSVVLPHTQRSWIGKAHMIGQTVKPTYYRPGNDVTKDDGTTHSRPLPPGSASQEEWILVDGTPASCVQIGLYHFFQDLGPIDLVVSGPNYGRNSTAVFALSSGTLGGALEAAVCKKKAIAVSYAFESRNHDPVIIAGAARQSVKVIESLYKNWSDGVDLYSVNVPLIENVENNKVLITNMLQNYWGASSCFEEVDDPNDAEEAEQKIREEEGSGGQDDGAKMAKPTKHTHKHFKWSPRFSDVYKSVEESSPGNDGWALKQGYTRYVKQATSDVLRGLHLSLQCYAPEVELYARCARYRRRIEAVSLATHSVFAKYVVYALCISDVHWWRYGHGCHCLMHLDLMLDQETPI
jgi:tubulin--tyrosine ligase